MKTMMINDHDNSDGDTVDDDNNGDKIIMVMMLDSLCTKLCRSWSGNGRRRCTAAPPKLENGILGYYIIIRIIITTGSSRKDDKIKRFSWALKFTMNGLLSFFSCPGRYFSNCR